MADAWKRKTPEGVRNWYMGESTDASANLMFLKSRGFLAVRKDSRVVSMIMNPIRFLDGRLSCTHLIFDSLGVRYGLAWNSAPLRLIGLRHAATLLFSRALWHRPRQ